MKAFAGLLVFVALTVEYPDFASGLWNTFMVHARPLFVRRHFDARSVRGLYGHQNTPPCASSSERSLAA